MSLRKAVELVCEGWTLPEAVRKILETALQDEINCKPPIITLDAKQLYNAFDFAAPEVLEDIENSAASLSDEERNEQLETKVCIQYKEDGKNMDGEDAPAGYYCWIAEYPEEGGIPL